MDDVYELPYMRTYHPSYEALGGVPAISEIKCKSAEAAAAKAAAIAAK